MKKYTLSNLVLDHSFSSTIEDFWNNEIKPYQNLVSSFHKLVSFQASFKESDISNFFTRITKLFNIEKEHQSQSNTLDEKFYSIQFLSLLQNENFDFTTILQNSFLEDPNNKSKHPYDSFLPMYALWLKSTNQTIPNDLLDNFLNKLQDKKSRYDYDTAISTFFDLINVLENKDISYPWFKQTLESFTYVYFDIDDAIPIDKPDESNIADYLNYKTQLSIFNFIKEKFPDHLQNCSQYYPHFFDKKSFVLEDLYTISLNINFISFAFENNLQDIDLDICSNLIKHSLFLISSNEFNQNIDPDLHISFFSTKEEPNYSKLTIFLSASSLEEKQKIQDFLIPTIYAILKDSRKFYASATDDNYYDSSNIDTNLTLDVFSKYYLHAKFNSSLDNKTQPTTIKKQKL